MKRRVRDIASGGGWPEKFEICTQRHLNFLWFVVDAGQNSKSRHMLRPVIKLSLYTCMLSLFLLVYITVTSKRTQWEEEEEEEEVVVAEVVVMEKGLFTLIIARTT